MMRGRVDVCAVIQRESSEKSQNSRGHRRSILAKRRGSWRHLEFAQYRKALAENDEVAIFNYLVNFIIEAGFPAPETFDILHDAAGKPWPKLAHQMSPPDIVAYIDARLG